jgi:superfamily II DNA or RNA helicase
MAGIMYFDQMTLWQHQRDAIKEMSIYVDAYQNGETDKSALVHMPTGSGKTGVIAVLSRCVPNVNSVLVLTNRIAIREQLTRHVHNEFFEMLNDGPDIDQLPKQVIELVGHFDELDYKNIDDTVFVATIQKIQYMKENHNDDFCELLNHITLILFDEGHYEPARKWSQTIRAFKTPRILFTATPYRNDLKLFDFDTKYIYSYTYHDGVNDGYLRELKFVDRDYTTDPKIFIDDVIEFYEENLGTHLEQDSRVIIRCENRSNIRLLTRIIREKGYSAISLHEQFSDTDENEFEVKKVPNPKSFDAIFWVHQFKLLEGIDDSRFQLLAIYDPFSSIRQLIQQVGRVIRNPSKEQNIKGYVIDHSADSLHQGLWEGFLSYDRSLKQDETLGFAIGQDWLEKVIKAQPGLAYIEGSFRELFDIEDIAYEDILIPQRVNFLQKLDNFTLEKLCDHISNEFDKYDRIHRLKYFNVKGEEKRIAVFVYIDLNPSPSLKTKTFYETRLTITLIYEANEFIAYHDDHGSIPKNEQKLGIGKPLNPRLLKKLFTNDEDTYLTRVSLINSNLGARNIRSRAISAAKLQDTISALDDHAQICSTATGYVTEKTKKGQKTLTRRYVGLSSGRISQPKNNMTIDDYVDWVDELVQVIKKSSSYKATFNRYAPEHIEEIVDPTPVHILLDLYEIEDRFSLVTLDETTDKTAKVLIPDTACEIINGKFVLLANDQECNIEINYDNKKNQYILGSADLDRLYRSVYYFDRKGIVDYLNKSQSFRVIPNTEGMIYVYGEFYKPLYKLGDEFDINTFPVGKTLFEIPELAKIKDEKSPVFSDGTGWDTSCLFGFLDKLGEGTEIFKLADNPDIIICDDMGTEIADFIFLAQEIKKIIFVHAKSSKKKRLFSASALQEICGQATKNINYLGMFNTELPSKLKSWDGGWKSEGNSVNRRIRRGSGSGEQLWSVISNIINHPLAEKEVWLVLGQTLSKERFIEEISKSSPTPEAVQTAYLLHATMTSIASVGAKMRIFCSP